MSIIFQKLKGVANVPRQGSSAGKSPLQEKKIYALKKIAVSPAGSFIVVAAISSFVIIIFFIMLFLKTTLDSDAGNAVIIQKSHNTVLPSSDNMGQATSKEVLPADVSPSGTLPLPDNAYRENTALNGHRDTLKKFTPPAFFLKQKQTIPPKTSGSLLNTSQRAEFKIKNPVKIPAASGPSTSGPSDTKAPDTENKIAIRKKVVITAQADKKLPDKKYIQVKEHTKTNKYIKDRKHIKANHVKQIMGEAEIEQIANDLDEAFQTKNKLKTDKLLVKLIHLILLKKEKSNYYLKLMAFKEIRRARYESAKRFLNKVLEKNKNDLEAGINMAVIEIKQTRYRAAKKRLIRLKELYPSNNEIDTLLNQLLPYP